jgi:glycosyltransferase involved in cell wall biosynthesis
MSRSPSPMTVAMLMPPVTDLAPDDAVDRWTTVSATVAALVDRGDVVPTVHGRHASRDAELTKDGVTYRFHSSDSALVAAVRASRPTVVHVHGLGWSRLVHRLRTVGAPVLLQHHGERVFTGRARWGHRLVRRHVAGYLFTGAASGHLQPWIDAGVVGADARSFEVLEAAAMLPDDDGPAVALEGEPAVLWVGRLVAGKDPITAVRGFGAAVGSGDLADPHLHLLATDRSMEAELLAAIAESGQAARIHVHDPVAHGHVGAWFAAAHVYLSTSLHEAASYSLLEAMSRGAAPAVTDIPPHRAVVGDIGALFTPGDSVAAASAIRAAVRLPREPILERSRRLLSWSHVADQLVAAYGAIRD